MIDDRDLPCRGSLAVTNCSIHAILLVLILTSSLGLARACRGRESKLRGELSLPNAAMFQVKDKLVNDEH